MRKAFTESLPNSLILDKIENKYKYPTNDKSRHRQRNLAQYRS